MIVVLVVLLLLLSEVLSEEMLRQQRSPCVCVCILCTADSSSPCCPPLQTNMSGEYRFLKFVLVGDHGVGKSAIAQRFAVDGFPNQYKPTVGVDFYKNTVFLPGRWRWCQWVMLIRGSSPREGGEVALLSNSVIPLLS